MDTWWAKVCYGLNHLRDHDGPVSLPTPSVHVLWCVNVEECKRSHGALVSVERLRQGSGGSLFAMRYPARGWVKMYFGLFTSSPCTRCSRWRGRRPGKVVPSAGTNPRSARWRGSPGGRNSLVCLYRHGGHYAKASILAGLSTVIARIASSEKPLRRILGTMFSRMWP